LSTERRKVVVRPWSLDELPATTALGMALAAGAAWEGAPLGGAPPAAAEAPVAVESRAGAAWTERLEVARAEALAEGYQRGYAEGEQVARAERAAAVEAAAAVLRDAAAAIRAHEARWSANLEENLAALAVLVARHVVQREVAADPALVRALVSAALAQYPVDDQVTVRLHPDDLQQCRTLQGEGDGALPDLRWVGDPTVERGGCLLEGRERILDGRLDVALERAYRALAGVGA
jgi:flagellar assembly protein FliH